MAARPMASATISFGLVSIPCKLFPTVDNTNAVRFNYLSKDGSRLRQQYIRASDGEVVEREDRVQGYQFAKGQYVTFTADELKALNVVATNAIDIDEFIPLADVERLYIERVYYLGPDKGAGRSYHLLRAALTKTGRAALARYAARGKSYLVLIRPMGEALVMEQLKHADDLRQVEEVPLDVCEVNDGELDLAVQIIGQRTNGKFEPENYTDEVKSRVLELIQQKIDGQDISVAPEEKPEAKIIDLMEALRQSVADHGGAGKESKPAKRASGKRTAGKGSSGESGPEGEEGKVAASAGRREG
ncbi:MAG: Ku protein [Gammaproteobacteria bacterium]|nr:Ku protein [Gammaproteobacteria bacterium]